MRRILMFVFCACLAGTSVHAQKFDIYLLIGQSNMAGRGWMVEGDEQIFDENVYLLDDGGEPVPATNPLNKYSSIGKGGSKQQICPGFGFSKKLSKETGRKILLVVNARGGTMIRQWMKGATDGFYEEAVKRTRQAMKHGELKAILWHQGCGDSRGTDYYMDSLSVFVENLRKDLETDVPFIVGELGRWRAHVADFNEMLHSISDIIPNSDYVSSDGCLPIVTSKSGGLPDMNDAHFDRESQILLGERYADKVLKMCYNIK